MANVSTKTVKTITLELSENEAYVLRLILGELCGSGEAYQVVTDVWKQLHDVDLNIESAPVFTVRGTNVGVYVNDLVQK